MKVLVFGGGGREHALAWAIAQSPRVTEIAVAPGNGGIAVWGRTCAIPVRCIPIEIKEDATSLAAMLALALSERPELTVIGPEVPLALGLVDELERHGLRVFGPTRAAAMLETSKAFAKEFMRREWHSDGCLLCLPFGGGGCASAGSLRGPSRRQGRRPRRGQGVSLSVRRR